MEEYILTLSCPDRVGIVAAVSGFLAKNGGFILESNQFGDSSTDIFFMRTQFTAGKDSPGYEKFLENFQEVADSFEMSWRLKRYDYKPKVLIMVSKEGHCLNALLNKTAMGTLKIEIPAIVSNHNELREMADWYKTPYHHLPVTAGTKSEQEGKVMELIDQLKIDLVVLARYMQILSPDFVKNMWGKVINIHHSFLPSFKGAKPYHQAYERGVKLIGATAHYVTEDLDEGPIIEQEVMRVDHKFTPQTLVSTGQDIESIALLRAVKWHSEQRIFLDGKKTVIFR